MWRPSLEPEYCGDPATVTQRPLNRQDQADREYRTETLFTLDDLVKKTQIVNYCIHHTSYLWALWSDLSIYIHNAKDYIGSGVRIWSSLVDLVLMDN